MKKFKEFIENLITESKHDYGCVMLYLDFPELKNIHNIINKNDIYIDPNDDSFGLETEPHVTLLYGLHDDVSLDDIKNVIENYTFDSCKIINTSLFETEKYDVLKFDVKSSNLHEINKLLTKFPYTTDYPDYHPHMTIAYLKPGTGKKYIDKIKLENNFIEPLYVVYSMTDGSKKKININID